MASFYIHLNSQADIEYFPVSRNSVQIKFTNRCNLDLLDFECALVSCYPLTTKALKIQSQVTIRSLPFERAHEILAIGSDIVELSQYGSAKLAILRMTDQFGNFSPLHYVSCTSGQYNSITAFVESLNGQLEASTDLVISLHFRPKLKQIWQAEYV